MDPALLHLIAPLAATAFGSDVAGAASSASMLDAAAAQSAEVAKLWWFFFYICLAVFASVVAVAGVALWRARHAQVSSPPIPELHSSLDPQDRGLVFGVSSALALTVAILFTMLIRDFFTDRALRPLDVPDALTVKVTGHQWWWEIEYEDPQPQKVLQTANEIHIPVGRPINLQLQSTDVIHSFWVPRLSGKKDLVPGHPTSMWIRADRPGVYYGQCAEFCGYQHANMKLLVFVDTPEAFAAWQQAQSTPAPEPTTDKQRRGRELVMSSTCAMCHSISGTNARSHVGPTLSGLAGRRTLGAGSLPNTRAHLMQWILNPQASKPGVRMPQNNLSPEELDALVDYLETLH